MEESIILEIANKKILDYAGNQTPEIWHQMVMDWNWDSEFNFLEWLIKNKKTDKATILMIYWKSNPGYGFKNKELIENNFSTNYYSEQSLFFDYEDDEGDNWREENEEGDIKIPEYMFVKLDGKHVSYPDGLIEGIPEDLFYEIEELYD